MIDEEEEAGLDPEELEDLDSEDTELDGGDEYDEDEPIARPDVPAEMARLKDFQRRTVEAVFQRLYLDDPPRHRFLVADEVGLGKTLVARGVVAKVLDHLWEKVERLDIVYLCSNAAIARQNVSRLLPHGAGSATPASRITLLPKTLRNLEQRKVNVFALTPGTSLDLKGNLGVKSERVLILQMLLSHWGLPRTGAARMFRGNAGLKGFRSQLRQRGAEVGADATVPPLFCQALDEECRKAESAGERTIRERVSELCEWFGKHRRILPKEKAAERAALIGELRGILARVCIDMLEPDLIILDEFQRFRDVLDGTGQAGEMAKQLFEYETTHTKARVLLLSATPYKMYTVRDEAGGDDHYKDFVRTAGFLLDDPAEVSRLSETLEGYRRQLFRLGQGAGDEGLAKSRQTIEEILRKVMVRTERLAVSEDRSGMLRERGPGGVVLESRDARAYREIQQVARTLEQPDSMEYWKAAPWLFSFMDGYKLREAFDEWCESETTSGLASETLSSGKHLVLDPADIASFTALDPAHGRMRWLLRHTLDSGLWRLLWLPPTVPYYQLGAPFAELAEQSPTKMLLFSAWRVVPRVVAAILSHEAERRAYAELEGVGADLTEAWKRHGQALRLVRQDGRLAGMPVLAMMYPCAWIARECDPLWLAGGPDQQPSPGLDDLLRMVKQRIGPEVQALTANAATSGPPDESWYWALPILLDRRDNVEELEAFFGPYLAYTWAEGGHDAGDIEAGDLEAGKGWRDHVAQARDVAQGNFIPTGRPPEDLLDVLALMAVGGPGTVALRALVRVCGKALAADAHVREGAAQIAWQFRSLFNQPDSTAIVRNSTSIEVPYWQQCLRYACSGGLQGVLDEYAHLMVTQSGSIGKDPYDIVDAVVAEVVEALSLRRSVVGAHTYRRSGSKTVKRDTHLMRARFAVRFGEERADAEGNTLRADTVRKAFNSPFAPFVLATTSVGQEGLDFHLYCHAVVHWNLPSNPVDLEQREGRVHRFKGHAVRKNVVRRNVGAEHRAGHDDPWEGLFEAAAEGRADGDSELTPFWVYPDPEGAAIERYAPAYSLSRDTERLVALRRSLAVYRMVFGQPRQEELLAYLARTLSPEEMVRYDEQLRVSLAP